jgi:hypothetical protein
MRSAHLEAVLRDGTGEPGGLGWAGVPARASGWKAVSDAL